MVIRLLKKDRLRFGKN